MSEPMLGLTILESKKFMRLHNAAWNVVESARGKISYNTSKIRSLELALKALNRRSTNAKT